MVTIHFEKIEILDLSPEFFRLWLSDVCVRNNCRLGEINIIFCSDDYLLEINKQRLNHDNYTDIITFDYSELPEVSGDLFVSVERVRENALTYNQEFLSELNRVVCHGILHLLGYNDKSEDEIKQMREKESEALGMIVSRET